MEPIKDPQPPTGLAKYLALMPLYVRIGFMLIVIFGLVGNCAGKVEGSLVVFVLVSILWVCSRILQEGFQSLQLLGQFKQWEEEKTKKQPPPPADDNTET